MAREAKELLLTFPFLGVDVVAPREQQPQSTCFDLQNVQFTDTLEGRQRGGIRPGLSKYHANTFGGTGRIQCIDYATTVVDTAPPTGGTGLRTILAVAVRGGTVSRFNTTTITAATAGGSRTLSSTSPVIFSTELFGRIYFTDGISYKIWIASNNTLSDWTPTAGSIPGTDGTAVARLIETWGSRIVLSGLASDPHNYFITAIDDPLDFDYAPANPTDASAVAGDVGILGKIGDPITSIIPYNDDILLLATDHSLWAMGGNPAAGAGFDIISDSVGVPFGKPWCMDSTGQVYIFSTKGTIYRLAGPSSPPEPITNASIAPLLDAINLNTNLIRMAYDEVRQGFWVFITPYTAAATTHWYYDARTQGWFKYVFAATNHNPMTVKVYDGDAPTDRVILIGSEDGYVRFVDDTVSTDDGTAISSYVIMGPISGGGKPVIITELQGNLDPDSSSMLYEVGVGDTPQAAAADFAGSFTGDGTLAAGRGVTHNPRLRGFWSYIKVGHTSSSTPWAFESIRVKYSVITSSKGRRHTE